MLKYLSEITPYIVDLKNNEINLSNTSDYISITCEPWGHIRVSQQAILFINDECISSMHLSSKDENLALPPIFKISTKDHFVAGESYKIHIHVIEYDESDSPNQGTSADLLLNIKN